MKNDFDPNDYIRRATNTAKIASSSRQERHQDCLNDSCGHSSCARIRLLDDGVGGPPDDDRYRGKWSAQLTPPKLKTLSNPEVAGRIEEIRLLERSVPHSAKRKTIKLAEDLEYYVRSVVRRFGMAEFYAEDLMQEARRGLWKAIKTFNPGKSFHFFRAARIQIMPRLWRYMKQMAPEEYIRRTQSQAVLDYYLREDPYLRDMTHGGSLDPYEATLFNEIIEDALVVLDDPRDRQIVRMRYLHHMSWMEIGRLIETNPDHVRVRATRAMEKLARHHRR